MVRSLFISSLLALSAVVSAVPALLGGSLADIDAGWIGTEDIIVDNVLNDAAQVNGLSVDHNLGNARVLSDGDNIRGYDNDRGDYGIGENDYGDRPFEYVEDNDNDGDFEDYFDDSDSGCGGGRGGNRGRGRRPRPPHRISRPPRVRGGCR
ncbi:hypothetical protein K501DRAFT_276173 [Backusella circina FSU 941]|nr:hypothetical protein K501DRAFT_280562 [Backusella circina FSU 941]KAI8879812.1 hypothetical protein K501DRAFT_276173 [Backusella circina FSU 941]